MIIVGYQCIGKSTLANMCLKYIDLESGSFWHDGKRPDDWYIYYCQIAEHLSKQGYNVFVSSHEPVRKFLKNSSERVIAIAPSIELKDQWIEKLKNRYEASKLDKDYRAYMNAVDRYTENIKEIAKDCDTVFIRSMTYDIESLIEAHLDMAKCSSTIFDGI